MGEGPGNIWEAVVEEFVQEGVTFTLNAQFRLVEFIFLHQLYITPHKYNTKYHLFVLDVAWQKESSSVV